MKKLLFVMLVICLLLTGCSNREAQKEAEAAPKLPEAATEETVPEEAAPEETEPEETESEEAAPEETEPEEPEQAVPAVKIHPLPDTIMDHLQDATLSISLEEGGAYVDDTGKLQMDVKIYSYDKYDMVDMAMLKVGDILVSHAGEVEITAMERDEKGTILINGGLSAGGFDLTTNETGFFYECGYNDAKNWYEIGEATIPVSADFVYHDMSDLDSGETLYYPGSFLNGEVTDYHFTPHNTTIRVENGQIIEMHRIYIP